MFSCDVKVGEAFGTYARPSRPLNRYRVFRRAPFLREDGADAERNPEYSPELRERAVRMVFDHAPDHPSQWAAIRSVAEKLGCTVEALRRWVRQAERDRGERPGLTTDERDAAEAAAA